MRLVKKTVNWYLVNFRRHTYCRRKKLESAGYPILHLVMFTDAVHISITAYACIQNVFARAFMPRKKAHFILQKQIFH